MTCKIPTTMEEAIDYMLVELSETAKMQIKGGEIESHVSMHHGYGTAIRNDFSLWDEKSPLVLHFRKRFGLGHADDISGILVAALFARIKGAAYDPTPQVRSFKAHWAKLGLDPMDQVPISGEAKDRGKPPFNWWGFLGLRRGV